MPTTVTSPHIAAYLEIHSLKERLKLPVIYVSSNWVCLDSISTSHYCKIKEHMRRLSHLIAALCILVSPYQAAAQYIVTSVLDLPDEDLTDNVYAPPTLRAAIENANKMGVATAINISGSIEYQTINLEQDLPVINVTVSFEGKGIVLQPGVGSRAKSGFLLRSNQSVVRNFLVQNFSGSGIVWQGSDGLIEMVISRNNGVGLNLNYAKRNTIGGKIVGYYSNYFYGNVGDGGNGINVGVASDSNTIQFCALGIDENGQSKGNSRSGIRIGTTGNKILSNLISANEYSGIEIDPQGKVSNTLIRQNNIGLDRLGVEGRGNGTHGINLFNSSGDTITSNVISGNASTGINVSDIRMKGIVIIDNKIGCNRLATKAVPNTGGIRLNGSDHLVFRNEILGNRGTGISTSAQRTAIYNNYIGIDKSGKTIIGNGGDGIHASQIDGGLVGDIFDLEPNYIGGNAGYGISLGFTNDSNLVVSGNVIGTGPDLSLVAPNESGGILVTYNVKNVVIQKNTIAFSGKNAIDVRRNVITYTNGKPTWYQRPTDIEIKFNAIGVSLTDQDSTGVIDGDGISVWNADTVSIVSNTIRGTGGNGISLVTDSTHSIHIGSNEIGKKSTLGAKRSITHHGISVSGAHDCSIGSAVSDAKQMNFITDCGNYGIHLEKGAQRITFHQNIVCDLDSGAVQLDSSFAYYQAGWNDDLDVDSGSNGWHNTVRIDTAIFTANSVNVLGEYHGGKDQTVRIDVYLDLPRVGKPFHTSEMCKPIGWFAVKCNNEGVGAINQVVDYTDIGDLTPIWPEVRLTATGYEGTSALSVRAQTSEPPDRVTDVAIVIDSANSVLDDIGNVTLRASIVNTGSNPAYVIAIVDSLFGAFEVDSARISIGNVYTESDIVRGVIPSLLPNQEALYEAFGRAVNTGKHSRKVSAIQRGPDVDWSNNIDSIKFDVKVVNSVAEVAPDFYKVQSANGIHTITSATSEVLTVTVYDVTGRAQYFRADVVHNISVSPGIKFAYIVTNTGKAHYVILD